MSYLLISPCRDEAKYMRETLDSVSAQSLRPAKWVIVDDGSWKRWRCAARCSRPASPASRRSCSTDVDALAAALEDLLSRPAAELQAMGEVGHAGMIERHSVDASAARLAGPFAA